MCLEIGETTFSKRDGCSIVSINNVGKIFMDLRSERSETAMTRLFSYLPTYTPCHATMQGSE
jgi:hypothetical protein